MPRISKEESAARRAEIVDACEALYRSTSYHDITMTQIAAKVSFGRANVYNYFRNKDEVLLALLQREHETWASELSALAGCGQALGDDALAGVLAGSVGARTQMLKILAMNLYDIEQNSRMEKLVEFKLVYRSTVEALKALVRKGKPSWNTDRVDLFTYTFMPLLHGVYPYVFHSEKQLAAMVEAGVKQPGLSAHALVYACAQRLLQG